LSGSRAPNTIFLGPEEGTETLDVKRYPKTRSWQDVLDAVDDLTLSEHSYKALAIAHSIGSSPSFTRPSAIR